MSVGLTICTHSGPTVWQIHGCVFIPTDLSELDNPSQKEQIIRLEGPHPFKARSPIAMPLLTNICSICSQSSPVLEIPHLPQTANFPASFPSATESFIHYLTWISSFATTGISSTTKKEKRNALFFATASEPLPSEKSSFVFGYVLPISRLQLFGHYNLKNFPQNAMHFKSFHCANCCSAAFASQTSWDLFFSAQPRKEALILQSLLRVFADSKLKICLISIIAE